jgi:hypothetical protein
MEVSSPSWKATISWDFEPASLAGIDHFLPRLIAFHFVPMLYDWLQSELLHRILPVNTVAGRFRTELIEGHQMRIFVSEGLDHTLL